ncbi:hypothetical protein [Roseobacter litoralis]|uniref:hypothetical protein n=1 Tax=Roseobacter litoralis TaxID=42443 RepID=UPI002493A35B|nr:hypothetical protein [Roseobacter litoralis]
MGRNDVGLKGAREAVSGLSAFTGASHDSLVEFSNDLKILDRSPDFWSGATPVWTGVLRANETPSYWPILDRKHQTCTLRGVDHGTSFVVREVDLINRILRSATETLSAAELHVAIDLAQGLTLNESAQLSGVSAATRRKQVQNVFRKLKIGSQTELVLFITDTVNQFVIELIADAPGTEDRLHSQNSTFSRYQKHLPQGARWGAVGAPNGRAVQYVDIGPIDGQPVMILHSMVFPYIDIDDVALFHELGWRTLWPIRPGTFSPANHHNQKWQTHCDQVVEDMRVLLDAVTQDPVPLIALVSGGAYATSFAELYPNRVRRIDCLATCFTAGKGGDDDYFFDRMVHKLTQNGRFAALAVAHLARSLGGNAGLEKSTRRVYRDSNEDQALLDEEFRTSERRERFEIATLQSLDSMRMDYLSQIHFSWDRAHDIPHSVRFWHGTEDHVNNLDQVTRLSHRVSNNLPFVIPGLGHLTQGQPIRAAFRAVGNHYVSENF